MILHSGEGEGMATYGRIVISRSGGPEVLDVVEDELRDAREGEVRVKVLAAGVSWWSG
jgi:NADPH:quinone reductase-like Zn-dependent oxidoreductase